MNLDERRHRMIAEAREEEILKVNRLFSNPSFVPEDEPERYCNELKKHLIYCIRWGIFPEYKDRFNIFLNTESSADQLTEALAISKLIVYYNIK